VIAIPKRARVERTDEAAIQFAIRERLGKEPDLLLFRNAQAFGERIDPKSGAVTRFSGGLGKGSADLVGLLAPKGRWVSLEVKRLSGGRISPEQHAWIHLVRSFGGFACVVRSVDDALAALERARMGLTS
jgi:hypothetical protein